MSLQKFVKRMDEYHQIQKIANSNLELWEFESEPEFDTKIEKIDFEIRSEILMNYFRGK